MRILLLVALTFTLLACDKEKKSGGDRGKGGGLPFNELIGGSKENPFFNPGKVPPPAGGQTTKPLVPGDLQRCTKHWKRYVASYRVGEKLVWATTYNDVPSTWTEETIEANDDRVETSGHRMDRLEFMYQCERSSDFLKEWGGKDGKGEERVITPAGTFDTIWRRDINRQPNREEDITLHTIRIQERTIIVKKRRKLTEQIQGKFHVHVETMLLKEMKP